MSLLVSICILTYKRARALSETLDAVLPQVAGRSDVEVFVFDDASPDNTEEVMRGYCARHPRLRYLRIPVNVGQDGNVVTCIENAAGEYIALFSDDDLVPPDFVSRLVNDLVESRPLVAYFNHTPFFNNNPAQLGNPTQPVLKRVFTNPTEYFLYTGLGFMTALTIKTSEARKYVQNIARGLCSAHVDIASRVVLSSSGPFLFDGTLTVWARYEINATYDVLTNGAMNISRVHLNLLKEGLLTQADVAWHNRKTIRLFLPRCIVNNRLNSRKPVPARELRKLYGKEPSFYRLAYPLALIPPPLLRWVALPLRSLWRMRRARRLKSGKMGQAAIHLAPP